MTPYTHTNPNTSYPLPPSSVHDAHLLSSSVDQDFSDPSLTLAFVDGRSPFDQTAFIASSQSTTASSSADPIDEFGLPPFSVLASTPLPIADSLDHNGLSANKPVKVNPGDGPKLPKADPWTSVAVTGQSMTANSQLHLRAPTKGPNQRPHTDSGYASSLLSGSAMPITRPIRRGQNSFQDDSRMEDMQHVLVDQQLPSAMTAATPLPHNKPRSASTSTARLDSADGFFCSTCKTPFSTSSEHQKHMARHEKKHKCAHPECTRHAGFATSNDLDRHRRGVHGDIGLDDPVWRCFVDGCKTAEKLWPRQDNFKAHIDRMHKNVDVAEYVRKSEQWFENEEKPRRQKEYASHNSDSMNNQDLGIGQFQQYSGAITEQNYPASHPDHSDYARSIAGEFPESRQQQQQMWGMGAGLSMPNRYVNMYSPSFANPALIPYTAMDDSARGYSDNPVASFSSMTHSGQQNDPPLPFAHNRDNDFMESFRNANVDGGFANIVKPLKARTLPDQERINEPYFPDWQTPNYNVSSPTLDMAPTNPTLDLSFMGGENTAPSLNFPDGDVLSSDTPSTTDFSTAESLPTAEQITEKNNQELRHEVAQLISKCSDPSLAQMLKESIAKTIKDYATSTTVNIGTTSGQAATDTSHDPAATYTCRRKGCDKTFAMKNRLTKHEKRHDRIFFCTFDACYKSFGTKTDLSRHEYRVHKQPKAWRCWANNRTRDKNKSCAMLFHDEAQFEAHRKEHHSKIQWHLDAFKVERDFAGAFWCGFCNAVVQNPVPVDVDGLKRVQHRYQHIEDHMNETYRRSPNRDAMQDWYELAGEGKTKAAMRDNGKSTGEHAHEDEDTDEEDEMEGISSRTEPTASAGTRPRALTDNRQRRHGQYLQVPQVFNGTRKRAAEFATPNLPASQMYKVRRVQPPRSDAGGISVQRHASMGGISGNSMTPFQQQSLMSGDQTGAHSIVAYIKCCRCNSQPRVNEGYRTCNNCFEPNCEKCLYYNSDRQPLQVTMNATTQSMN